MNAKKLILAALLSATFATATAGGIPVIDGVANARDTIHQAQEIIQMAKEVKQWADTIKHYKNELSELKETKNALNGLKQLVSYDSDVRDLVNSFEDLMSGNPDKILSRAEKYFDGLDKLCQDAKNKEMCQNASLSEIVQLDFSEKLNKRFEKELENIEILQKKAANAEDAKSIAEVQAAIALQQNKIQLLAIQTENFNRLQQAQREIAVKQDLEKISQAVWEDRKAYATSTQESNQSSGYSDLFK
ncbi:MAG: hypothetical protein IIU35_04490 [Neisseriaceae bacterium]|nr:hypothetical protein [Neisseriaceae bacterium]